MTACNFTGRCALITDRPSVALTERAREPRFMGVLRLLAAVACLTFSAATVAEEPGEALIDAANHGWVDTYLSHPDDALDEQVFTDISPILDSPDPVKLPEDQRTED